MASNISINLDTSKENYILAKCKQDDDLTLEVSVFENGLALDLTNKEIFIKALKADNTYIIQSTGITKENNYINAELTRDFSRVRGTTKIEILLVEGGKNNTTFSFYLEVGASVIEGAVESADAITSLEEVQAAVTEIDRINEETRMLVNNAGAASKEDVNKINSSLEQNTKKLQSIVVLEYDRKGVIDASDIFNETINKIRQEIDVNKFKSNVILKIPSGIMKLTKTVTLPPYIHVSLEGLVVIQSSVNNAPTFRLTYLDDDDTYVTIFAKQEFMRSPWINASNGGLLIKSTLDKSISKTIALEIGTRTDVGWSYDVARYSLCDIAISGFDVGMQINEYNNYIGMFDKIHLELNNTNVRIGTDVNITGKNRGENFSWFGCIFATAKVGFEHLTTSFECNFYGCSFDFINTIFVMKRGYKRNSIFGGHIEGCNVIIDASTTNEPLNTILINGAEMFVYYNKMFKGKVDLILDAVRYRSTSNSFEFGLYMCDEQVNVIERGKSTNGNYELHTSRNTNLLNNDRFQQYNLANGEVEVVDGEIIFTQAGSTRYKVTTNIPSGGISDRAIYTTGVSQTMWTRLTTKKNPCKPGERVRGGITMYSDSLNLCYTSFQFRFYDINNELILETSQYSNRAGSEVKRWNSYFSSNNLIAPRGCSSVEMTIVASEIKPNEKIYISEVYIGIS